MKNTFLNELNNSETEELITSLIFSNYIKNNGEFKECSLDLLNKILHYAYLNGYTDIVKLVDTNYMLTDETFAKVVQLVAHVSGEKFDDLHKITSEILKEVRKINFN